MSNWGALGDIEFTFGPSDETWKAAVELAEHPRIAAKATLQLAALKPEELTLRVAFHAGLGHRPDEAIKKLRTAMEAGEVLPLVLGSGDSGCYAEDWLLSGIDVSAVERLPGGGPIVSLEATLQLREYVTPPGLVLSKRKALPPAVRIKGKTRPAVASGPGYEGGTPPGGDAEFERLAQRALNEARNTKYADEVASFVDRIRWMDSSDRMSLGTDLREAVSEGRLSKEFGWGLENLAKFKLKWGAR